MRECRGTIGSQIATLGFATATTTRRNWRETQIESGTGKQTFADGPRFAYTDRSGTSVVLIGQVTGGTWDGLTGSA